MKIISKYVIIIITISILISCSSDNEIEENISKGYWVENLTKKDFIDRINQNQDFFESKKTMSKDISSFIDSLPEEIEHYLVFEEGRFKEYITIRKDELVLIADTPSTINGNTLTIYHPDNSGKIISTIEILEGMILGHDITQSFKFDLSIFNKDAVVKDWPFSYGDCMGACAATHLAMNISWANDICCFWY